MTLEDDSKSETTELPVVFDQAAFLNSISPPSTWDRLTAVSWTWGINVNEPEATRTAFLLERDINSILDIANDCRARYFRLYEALQTDGLSTTVATTTRTVTSIQEAATYTITPAPVKITQAITETALPAYESLEVGSTLGGLFLYLCSLLSEELWC